MSISGYTSWIEQKYEIRFFCKSFLFAFIFFVLSLQSFPVGAPSANGYTYAPILSMWTGCTINSSIMSCLDYAYSPLLDQFAQSFLIQVTLGTQLRLILILGLFLQFLLVIFFPVFKEICIDFVMWLVGAEKTWKRTVNNLVLWEL